MHTKPEMKDMQTQDLKGDLVTSMNWIWYLIMFVIQSFLSSVPLIARLPPT